MSYLKPVVVASTMLVASLSAPAFANHMNYAATPQSQAFNNIASLADRNSPTSDVPGFNWEKRITVGGLLNVDAVYSQRGWADPFASLFGSSDFEAPPFSSESAHGSDIVVNNANLFVDAKINDATKAHIGIAYTQRPGELGSRRDLLENVVATVIGSADISGSIFGNDENLRLNSINIASHADFAVDEAYITFNDCSSPFYLQAGRKFTSFSTYNPYPITYTLTQLLAQTNEEVLEAGYMSNDGWHGSIYAFNGPLSGKVSNASNLTSRINNYGVDFGYKSQYNNIDYALGAGYVKDVRDSNFVSHQIANSLVIGGASFSPFFPVSTQSAGAYSLHADMNNGPFVLDADYVAAVRSLVVNAPSFVSGNRVWAYGLEAGYGFDSMGYGSKASVGYQRSGNGGLLNMARYRVLADYTVEVSRNAKVTLEYAHSKDYKASEFVDGGWQFDSATNNSTNTASLRIGVAI